MNVIILAVEIVAVFSMLLLSKKMFGKSGIIAWIAIATILANIFTTKSITLFGIISPAGSVMFGSIFLATDILNETYGKKEAKKGVLVGLFADAALIIGGQICRIYIPAVSDYADPSIQVIFALSLRITIASAVMFFVSNWADVLLYSYIGKLTKGKFMWLRNNVATITCNCLENFIFFGLAFIGQMEIASIISMAVATSIIEIIIGLCDTPFLYLAKAMKDRGERNGKEVAE